VAKVEFLCSLASLSAISIASAVVIVFAPGKADRTSRAIGKVYLHFQNSVSDLFLILAAKPSFSSSRSRPITVVRLIAHR
jgi:hypothetical protein